MPPVFDHHASGDGNIANSGPAQRKDSLGNQRSLIHTKNSKIVQIDSEEIRGFACRQAASRDTKRSIAGNRSRVKEPRGNFLPVNAVENSAFLLKQPQVILILTRVFQNVDLCLTFDS